MFEDHFVRAQATDVVDLPWGFALLQKDFPLSHYHNRIVVTSATTAADMLAAAEEMLAGYAHRYVTVAGDALGAAALAEFDAADYEHETVVTMVHSGAPIEPPAARSARCRWRRCARRSSATGA